MSDSTYDKIDRAYDDSLIRFNSGVPLSDSQNIGPYVVSSSSDISPSSISGSSFDNIWLTSTIKSRNYQPKSTGFLIDGKAGYMECNKLYVGVGGIIGGFLDIPNTTDANSFHVDASGNTWWGKNATGLLTDAPAYITNTGEAVFKNVVIGDTDLGKALQYTQTGLDIVGSTITGGTIQTAETGKRVILDSTNQISIYSDYDGGTLAGSIYGLNFGVIGQGLALDGPSLFGILVDGSTIMYANSQGISLSSGMDISSQFAHINNIVLANDSPLVENGSIYYNDEDHHFYGRCNGVWKQLDNA